MDLLNKNGKLCLSEIGIVLDNNSIPIDCPIEKKESAFILKTL